MLDLVRVAGGIVSVHHLGFGGGAVIQKKSGDEAFEFLAAYAALGGFAARSEHSTTTRYR